MDIKINFTVTALCAPLNDEDAKSAPEEIDIVFDIYTCEAFIYDINFNLEENEINKDIYLVKNTTHNVYYLKTKDKSYIVLNTAELNNTVLDGYKKLAILEKSNELINFDHESLLDLINNK